MYKGTNTYLKPYFDTSPHLTDNMQLFTRSSLIGCYKQLGLNMAGRIVGFREGRSEPQKKDLDNKKAKKDSAITKKADHDQSCRRSSCVPV